MPYNEIELLAPAGKWDVLETVVEAGADAVYLGGKRFNMRMLKPEFNFSEEELRAAVQYLHQRDKKLYVTINNLYFENEIKELGDYLQFLQSIEADALIVQDMAVVDFARQLGLNIPLHASVQMGIANSQAARFLEEHGFARAILSKNLSLQEIRQIHQKSSLVIEYFAHGDLCISHAGQCYMSSFLCNESGNRGRCIKPCRWTYMAEGEGASDDARYYLAHNDLCLYPHLRELLDAGVSSFKIEGRMRSQEFLSFIIKKYRYALDQIRQNPDSCKMEENDCRELNEQRVRDFCTGNLFARPDIDSMGIDGAREPFFPTAAFSLNTISGIENEEYQGWAVKDKPCLSVKVGNLETFKNIYQSGIDTIIIAYENISPNNGAFKLDTIAQAVELSADNSIDVWAETPRIVSESELHALSKDLKIIGGFSGLSGFMVNDLGSFQIAKDIGLEVRGGCGLNVTNARAARFLRQNGMKVVSASLELEWSRLKSLLESEQEIELMVQGPLGGIITDFCIPRAINQDNGSICPGYCRQHEYNLIDSMGQKYLIRTDDGCRNHIFFPYELCLLPRLPELISAGLKYLRIEGQYYSSDDLRKVIGIYKENIAKAVHGIWDPKPAYTSLTEIFPGGLTMSPLFTTASNGQEE